VNRESFKVPGYDCDRNPCGKRGCGTRPGAGHGIHNEEWNYVIKDGDVALTLTVGSGVYLDSVPEYQRTHGVRGYDLSLHVDFRVDDGDAGRECTFVPGGRCYQGMRFTTAIGADRFVKEQFVGSAFEQGEPFWSALEKKCAEWGVEARASRAVIAAPPAPTVNGVQTRVLDLDDPEVTK
jgi:hypothetical protein